MSKNFIITLNRECGAGATNIAKLLSKELDIPYYDKDMFRMVSDKSGVLEEFFHVNDERPGNNLLYKLIKELKPASQKPSLGKDIVSPDNLFRFQSELIKELAENESCIIIGRCADYILKDRPDTYHIFVYGDEYEKISRTQQLFNLSEKDARAMNRDMDKKRRLHYEYYTDRKWGDPQNHCMCLNTSALDMERCIRYILDLFE